MKVKLTNPDVALGMIDPVTMRSPFVVVDADGAKHTVAEADVPDNAFWRRRLRGKELELVEDAQTSAPIAAAEPTVTARFPALKAFDRAEGAEGAAPAAVAPIPAPAGELAEHPAPTGHESITPLTTRDGK